MYEHLTHRMTTTEISFYDDEENVKGKVWLSEDFVKKNYVKKLEINKQFERLKKCSSISSVQVVLGRIEDNLELMKK